MRNQILKARIMAVRACRSVGVVSVAAVISPLANAGDVGDTSTNPHLTPGIVTMTNLDSAGILEPLFSDKLLGLQQGRIGQARVRLGYGSRLPDTARQPNYKENANALFVPASITKELPSFHGANFVQLSYTAGWADGESDQPIENNGDLPRSALRFLHAPDQNTIYGIGVTHQKSDIDNLIHADPYGSASRSKRDSWGVQLLYGKNFSGPWAMTAKAEWDERSLDLHLDQYIAPGVSIPIEDDNQRDDRLYLESQIIGSFVDTPITPHGWTLRPKVGATFERNYRDHSPTSTVDITGLHENYGLVFTGLNIQKTAKATPKLQIIPMAGIGFQHEYANDFDTYIEEKNYVSASAGVKFRAYGQIIDISYDLFQGIKGNRRIQSLAVAFSFNF